jgi:hypothetical protein
MLTFKEFFNESVNLGSSVSDFIPLKDNYTITVYHGLDNARDLHGFLTYGTTGKIRAGRSYSYEANNNPYGLFVTPELKVAKEFAREYIIEFHTRVADLEAPVWPSGAFTIQGGMSEYWKDDNDRENYRNKLREELRNNKYDFISKSDRPELANTLYLYPERQALFTGELNNNSIKAIWVSENPKKINSKFIRYERRKFLQEFGDKLSEQGYETDRNKMGKNKVLKPRDKVTYDSLMSGIKTKYPKFLNTDEKIINLFNTVVKKDKNLVNDFVWPHQVDKAWEIIQNLQ